MATCETSSPIEISALAFQLLANEEANRRVAKFAKEIVNGGEFCNRVERHVPFDKALFLLDLLEIASENILGDLPNGRSTKQFVSATVNKSISESRKSNCYAYSLFHSSTTNLDMYIDYDLLSKS